MAIGPIDNTESRQLLFEFAEELTKKNKLNAATAKQIDRLLATYRHISEEEINRYIEKLTPDLRNEYKKTYYKYKNGGYAKFHSGIKPYRIESLSPQYRKEVQNAVDNSIGLIKTQNLEFLQEVQNKIRNWSTIPTPETRGQIPGEKKDISTALNTYIKKIPKRYDTKKHRDMILRDQSRKLVSSMNNITAKNGGAIGFIWHNRRDNRVVGNPSGKYPKPTKLHGDHWDRENKFYILKSSWAITKGLIKKTKNVIFDIDIKDGIPGVAPDCRCYAEYVYNIEDIPEEYKNCITKKGLEYIL